MKKFRVGDIVRVREWDNMKAEYGLNMFDSIDVPFSFTPIMKRYSGQRYRITDATTWGNNIEYILQDLVDDSLLEEIFGAEMLTLIKSHKNLEEIKKIRDSLYPEEEFKEGAL